MNTTGPWQLNIGIEGGMSAIVKQDDPNFIIGYAICDAKNKAQRAEDIANGQLMASAPDLLAMLTRLQVALGNFCCDNCISYDDMEESHTELLDASNAADELVKKVRGQ